MTTAGHKQTLIDLALERSGNPAEAWELATQMGVSLTASVEGLELPDSATVRNKRVVRRYRQDGTHPATEI